MYGLAITFRERTLGSCGRERARGAIPRLLPLPLPLPLASLRGPLSASAASASQRSSTQTSGKEFRAAHGALPTFVVRTCYGGESAVREGYAEDVGHGELLGNGDHQPNQVEKTKSPPPKAVIFLNLGDLRLWQGRWPELPDISVDQGWGIFAGFHVSVRKVFTVPTILYPTGK